MNNPIIPKHILLKAGEEAQIEQNAVIRASELVDKARDTALEEQRAEYVRKVNKLNSVEIAVSSDEVGDGWFNGFQNCKKEVLAILNGKAE